jgi:glycosyltransferase involved in cell wall biosynthesis
MQICLYTSTALPLVGGQEMVVDSLAREFLRAGHRVVVLAPRPTRHAQLGDEDLPYPVIRHPRFISKRYLVGAYCWWLLRAQARWQFDVIHCHGLYQPGYVAALSKNRIGVPLVVTSHGEDAPTSSHRLKHPKVRQRHIYALRRADSLVSISRFTRAGFEELCPDSRVRIVDIPNGVHLDRLTAPVTRPSDLDSAIAPGQYALFLGRLSHRKGIDVLLHALRQVPRNGRVQLVVAGDGDQRQFLESLAVHLDLDRCVRFVGTVAAERKTYLIRNSKFMVTPTRTWEGLPLTVLEGFAAGRFQVATAVPGIVDLVRHGETGLLAPPESPEGLAVALRQAFDDTEGAARMGRQARTVAEEHCWKSVSENHLRLYSRLIRPARMSEGNSS